MNLLPNPGKEPKLLNAYKPISILPALNKVWEKCLKLLMERCMSMDSFHRKQYGFRQKRSNVDAITQVMKIPDSCKKKG